MTDIEKPPLGELLATLLHLEELDSKSDEVRLRIEHLRQALSEKLKELGLDSDKRGEEAN